MKSKHILMVSHDFLPNIGGVASYIYEVSKALIAKGHRLTILTKYESFSTKNRIEKLEGMRVIRVPIPPIKKVADFFYRRRMRALIMGLEREEQPDVIHWHTLNKDAQMMKKLEVQALEVYTNHLSWFRMLYNSGNYAKIYDLMREPDVIICPSYEVERMSRALFLEATVAYTPNGVDEKIFRPSNNLGEEVKARYGISADELVVLSTNRMEPVKGMGYLIEAIPELLQQFSNVTFLLVGDGSQLKYFERHIRKSVGQGAKVIFTGKMANDQIKEVLNAADIYVQPSLMEGCSIAILEAMACGKPVIACDVGGNPDIITEETGRLVPAKSTTALKAALVDLIVHSERRKIMGINARKAIENGLTWTLLSAEIEQLYANKKISK